MVQHPGQPRFIAQLWAMILAVCNAGVRPSGSERNRHSDDQPSEDYNSFFFINLYELSKDSPQINEKRLFLEISGEWKSSSTRILEGDFH